MAKQVHDGWYRYLPKVGMPIGLHIMLKHVPEYQDILKIGVGATSEEALEHLHKVIRDVLRSHVVTSTLAMAHLTLMRYLLLCSSPTIASRHPAFARIKKTEIDMDLRRLLVHS